MSDFSAASPITTEFDTPEPIALQVNLPAGSVHVTATDTRTTRVDLRPVNAADDSAWRLIEESRVLMHGTDVIVDVPERGRGLLRRTADLQLRVELPTDSRVRISAASADLVTTGRLAEVESTTASGDVQVAEVTGDSAVKTASGDIRIDHVQGSVRIQTASGDISVDRAGGEVEIAVASGDTRIANADGSVHVSSASGDVVVRRARRGDVAIKTASGDVRVGVAAGTGVYLDLSTMSGDARSDLSADETGSGDCDLNLQVRTMTGDINITRAG